MRNKEALQDIFNECAHVSGHIYQWRECLNFILVAKDDGETLVLDRREALEQGQGDGTAFIEWLKEKADTHGIRLETFVMPDDPDYLFRSMEFFKRQGFTAKDDQLLFTREPEQP